MQQHTSVFTLNKLRMAATSRVMLIFYRVLALETCWDSWQSTKIHDNGQWHMV